MKTTKPEKTTTKTFSVGDLYERAGIMNVYFRDVSIVAAKKKIIFRARRLCIEKVKEYDELRKSTQEKWSKATVNNLPFNGLKDKADMESFKNEMDPIANEIVTIKFPELTLDEIDMDHYTPEALDELVFLGLIKDVEDKE